MVPVCYCILYVSLTFMLISFEIPRQTKILFMSILTGHQEKY